MVEGYPYIEAEVIYCAKYENACTPIDILGRRIRLAFLNEEGSEKALGRVVELLRQTLKWNEKHSHDEYQKAQKYLSDNFLPRPNHRGAKKG